MLTQAAGPSGHQRLDNITPAPAYRYYFSGRHVLSAVLDNLEATADLKGASLVVLTGNSAGGFGVYSNVDYLQARYTATRVVGAPIAGYEFYAWPYTGPGHTSSSLANFRADAMAGGAYNTLWNATAPLGCLAEHRRPGGLPAAVLLVHFHQGTALHHRGAERQHCAAEARLVPGLPVAAAEPAGEGLPGRVPCQSDQVPGQCDGAA